MSSGCQEKPVRAEGHGVDLVFVRHPRDLFAGKGLDHTGRVVLAGGGDEFAVTGEDHCVYAVLMLQAGNLFASLGQDHSRRMVRTGRGQILTIGTECHCEYGALMQKAGNASTRPGIDHPCVAVSAGCAADSNETAIWTVRDGIHVSLLPKVPSLPAVRRIHESGVMVEAAGYHVTPVRAECQRNDALAVRH